MSDEATEIPLPVYRIRVQKSVNRACRTLLRDEQIHHGKSLPRAPPRAHFHDRLPEHMAAPQREFDGTAQGQVGQQNQCDEDQNGTSRWKLSAEIFPAEFHSGPCFGASDRETTPDKDRASFAVRRLNAHRAELEPAMRGMDFGLGKRGRRARARRRRLRDR